MDLVKTADTSTLRGAVPAFDLVEAFLGIYLELPGVCYWRLSSLVALSK